MVYAQAELEKAAASIGVRILAEGELPESEKVQRFYLMGGLECLLGLWQSAGADELRAVIQRNKLRHTVTLRYLCNGSGLAGRIKSSGGLALLSAAAEDAHGALNLSEYPAFCLEIELPLP